MATKIVTKNSSTASAVPTASDLVQGELAVNVTDKRLFTEDNGGSIVELGTNPSTIDINAGTIDGTTIGASSASTGAFTTLTATGAFTSRGIDDNADATAITIDASENVGIGTSSPISKMQVNGANNGDVFYLTSSDVEDDRGLMFSNSSNGLIWDLNAKGASSAFGQITFSTNSAERMRIDASGNVGIGSNGTASAGATQQLLSLVNPSGTAGTAARLWLSGTNASTRGAYIEAEAQSTSNNHDLIFATSASSASPTEAMRIDASGNLLVGTTSQIANAKLQIQVADIGAAIKALNNGNWALGFYNSSGSNVGNVVINASSTSYNTSSDQRLKENIADADDAGGKIDAIQVRKFDWKADGSHQDYGMIAQELQAVAPEAVSAPEDPEEMMGVDYSKLVPMLIKEVQSLRNRVAQLEE